VTALAPEIEARLLPAPPRGWKRPALKPQTKLQVILNQGGKCKASGERLRDIKLVRFDHRPACWQRRYDPVTNDTVPSFQDPAFIDAIAETRHDERTFTDNGTGMGDLTHKAHSDRVTDREAEHRIAMALKEPGRKRPRKGTIRSRGFERRA
jgi:hypothetical protein